SGANLNLNFVQIGSANILSSGNVGTLNIQPGATVLTQFMRSGDGGSASGFINQTGGSVTVTGIDFPDANADGPLRIGHFPGQGASYNISGGSLSVPNGSLDVGTDGNETALNISGSAQVSVKHLEIDGRNASSPIGGIVRLSGGTLSVGDGGIGRGN